jgi:hypothetical protein
MSVPAEENRDLNPGAIRSGIPGMQKPESDLFDSLKQPSQPRLNPDYGDGRIAILRSFERDITQRVEALRDQYDVSIIGEVSYSPHTYPMYEITAVKHPDNPYIRLSGLVHGDEEAGGKAVIEFFEKHAHKYIEHFNFIGNPCVNPSGYETATLQAMNGYHPEFRLEKNTGNINRSFGDALPQQEARLIEASLRQGPERYLFSVDMHESPPYYADEAYTPDDAPKEAWLYESCRDESLRIGRALTDSLPDHIEACDWDTIYSDTSDGGVIAFSPDTTAHAEYTEPTSLDGHVFEHYTEHSFTTETPTGWKLEKRVEAQLHFLMTILDTYIERVRSAGSV